MCDTGYTVRDLAADLRDMMARGADEAEILREAPDLLKRLLLMKHNWLRSYMYEPNRAAGEGSSSYRIHEEPDHSLALFVVTWPATAETQPHDHGTWVVIAGLEGREIHHRWRAAGGPDEVERLGEDRIEPGTIVTLAADAIHSFENDSGAASVTLQLYGMNTDYTAHRNFTPRRKT
jgi:predicted metal-dependent enzyme (double-stranded beta helix superfamily)